MCVRKVKEINLLSELIQRLRRQRRHATGNSAVQTEERRDVMDVASDFRGGAHEVGLFAEGGYGLFWT